MGLTRRTESNAVFLSVKDYDLWQEFKTQKPNCDTIQVTNPETKEIITKYGLKYYSVVGHAVKIEEYKREHGKKTYIGYKLHLRDGADLFIVDMPYQSRLLRNFLQSCPNMNWEKPLSIRAFKGKNDNGDPEQAIWFQQDGQTIKYYFTKDHPNGMPEPRQTRTGWDFSARQEWLIDRMMTDTAPRIAAAAAKFAPPTPEHREGQEPELEPDQEGEPFAPVEGEVRMSPRRAAPGTAAPTTFNDPPEVKALIQRANLNAANREKVEAEVCDNLRALHIDAEKGQALVLACWAEAVEKAVDDDDILRRLYAIVQREKGKK